MLPNHSPWLHQLKRTRPAVPLSEDRQTDVIIVGGGIAGAATAFFALRDTDKKVILIEADKIAHGATGHNAGLVTSFMERPLSDLIDEFGADLAYEGQRSIESAWGLIELIMKELKMETPFYHVTSYTGLSHERQIRLSLEDNAHRLKAGLIRETIAISAEWHKAHQIDKKFEELYNLTDQKNLLKLVESKNDDYIGVLINQEACMNSAQFVEELIGALLVKYKDRFSLYEVSPVKKVSLKHDGGVVYTQTNKIQAKNVVLCTNGFENFSIINESGSQIDTKFHHLVNGRIGYMSGYLEPMNHAPAAICYFTKNDDEGINASEERYHYLTRRPHLDEDGTLSNLVCAGGPDKLFPDLATYDRSSTCSEEERILLDDFLSNNYSHHPKQTSYAFCWHGLMGYTPNGIRRIGPEPCNATLLYNLGCNGVGILPSIYGGKRIAQWLNNEPLSRSIFDPIDQSCLLVEPPFGRVR